MDLTLFSSYGSKRSVFRPLSKGRVSMYVCGITPYDTTHLGHAFTYVFFDTLSRYLEYIGFSVNYVQNVTDIDDDILRKAREQGKNWKTLGTFWTDKYLKDMKSLNVARPTHYVKATESIPDIIRMVSRLLRLGYAYRNKGTVYFRVKKFRKYGKLSRFTENQMKLLLKERGGNPDDQNKEDPLDFILWQERREGEPSWNSPWGGGRPGWHIECSAMINRYLGDRIDIHGGGRDLIFPHHESEIAQSESFTGKRPFARYFMHTGMVSNMGEKMSKSLGNLIMVSDLLDKHEPNAIRWMLLSHHYRKAWEYEQDELEEAGRAVSSVRDYLRGSGKSTGRVDAAMIKEFSNCMNDDINTPKALETIKGWVERRNDRKSVRHVLEAMGFIL